MTQLEYESDNGYRQRQMNARSELPTVIEKIRDLVPKNEVVLVYGLDWNPSVAYYSEHRTIMDRGNRPLHEPPISESLRLLKESGQPVGGMLNCKLIWNLPEPYRPPDVEGILRTLRFIRDTRFRPRRMPALCGCSVRSWKRGMGHFPAGTTLTAQSAQPGFAPDLGELTGNSDHPPCSRADGDRH